MKQTPRIQAKNLNITLNFFAPETVTPTPGTPATLATAGVFSAITPPAIGTYWDGEGGIYAGLMRGEEGQLDYHLIVARDEDGATSDAVWGSHGKDESGAKHARDGLFNTASLAESDNDHPAADWATNLDVKGHTDWYLPARFELALCYASVPELFDEAWYLSSTQFSPTSAWFQNFDGGTQTSARKDHARRARAVRRVVNTSTL